MGRGQPSRINICVMLYVPVGFSVAGANKDEFRRLRSCELSATSCAHYTGRYAVVSVDLGSMWNQPNHPEVLPMSTANPIADVSLQPVLPAAVSLSVPLASRVPAQTRRPALSLVSVRGVYLRPR